MWRLARRKSKLESDIHIDGREGTVSDGAADGTGKCETRIEGDALGLLLSVSHEDGDGGVREVRVKIGADEVTAGAKCESWDAE